MDFQYGRRGSDMEKKLNSTVAWRAGTSVVKENNKDYRIEKDSIGEKKIPADAYYGIQTLRAAENFKITGLNMHPDLLNNVIIIKKAAAITNNEIGLLSKEKTEAIVNACDKILKEKLYKDFIVDPIQGGAGTSLNMNVNEVVANIAIELLGGNKGDYSIVNPLDDVNLGQSTNDVIPTAGKMTAIILLDKLTKQLTRLEEALLIKAKEFDDVIKMGRTQLQDAVPIRLGQEFKAYASAVKRNIKQLEKSRKDMFEVNLGGTAIGTAINVNKEYLKRIVPNLNKVTGLEFSQAEDLIDATQHMDAFVSVSGSVKSCAVALSKIASDLRLLSSGPRTGLGEINLPAKQNGSSIMPGKVNPVIPEVVNQVAFNVIGNDVAIALAAQSGQLELNAFTPIILYNLFQSIDTLTFAIETFIDNCIVGITANKEKCRNDVDKSISVVTVIAPIVGYDKASEIAKRAQNENRSVKEIILEENILTKEEIKQLLDPIKMTEPQ